MSANNKLPIKFISTHKYCMLASALLIICLFVLANAQPVLASGSVGFSVNAVHSDKQINKNISYFDLMLSPGEEHVLDIDIYNNNENSIVTSIMAYTAGTNPSGVIEYDNINVTDDSLIISFADITTIEEPLICVPAQGTSRGKIKVKMPDVMYDGIVLGGVVIKKVEAEDDSEANTGGASIQNEYCYVIAVKISVNDTIVEPEFRLRSVEPALLNYHTSIAVNMQNYHAAIAKGIKMDANVYFNNAHTPLYTYSNTDFDVAPNSNFDFFIPCSGKLSAGNYRLQLTATHEDKVWEFDEEFTVSATDANSINENAVNIPSLNYYLIATIVLAILLIILIIIIIWLKLSKKKDAERD